MASTKEALAILLDVGPGMSNQPVGESNELQVSIHAINMMLQRKMFAESKDEVALILFGTDDTANELATDGSYQNITVARPLGPVDWDLLQYVQNDVKSGAGVADFLDALVVAMNLLVTGIQGKKGFASKRIVLFSNLTGEFADDQIEDIMGSMKEKEIELNVIGPDLDAEDDEDDETHGGAASNGGGESGAKPKTAQQKAGETVVRQMLAQVNGESYSFSEALPALSFFQSRQVRSTAWKQDLEIGSSLKIPIALYARLKEVKAKSFKNVYAKDADVDTERLRTYHLNNDEETEVDKTDTVDGHRYGSTLVPFSADDKEAMKYSTEKCFKVLGFTKTENVKRHQIMGDTSSVCVAQKENEAAVIALSALINALYDTNMVAVVRRVYARNGAVRLGCLVPKIKAKYECLYYFELAFSEDLRQFTFGSLPLNEAITPANKKFAPSDEQLEAVEELIVSMDLTTPSEGDEEDGTTEEIMKPKLTFNPYLQRLYQCLQHRALNPDEGLPELSAVVARTLKPPEEVTLRAEPVVEKLKQLFKLEPVAKKDAPASAENIFKDDAKNSEQGPAAKRARLDVAPADLLAAGVGLPDLLKAQVTEIGSATPVEDFLTLISRKDYDHFSEAHSMMCKRITQFIMESFGEQSFPKAMDCLRALRQQSIKNLEPGVFNDFLTDLKTKVVEGGRSNFWKEIVSDKLSLISKLECDASDVSVETSESFLAVAPPAEEKKTEISDEPNAEDLLGEME